MSNENDRKPTKKSKDLGFFKEILSFVNNMFSFSKKVKEIKSK